MKSLQWLLTALFLLTLSAAAFIQNPRASFASVSDQGLVSGTFHFPSGTDVGFSTNGKNLPFSADVVHERRRKTHHRDTQAI